MSNVIVEKITDICSSKELVLKEFEQKTIIVFNNGTNECSFSLNAKLEKGAILNIYNVATTDKNASINETIDLLDAEATCNILNVLLVGKNGKLDSNIMINHLYYDLTDKIFPIGGK